MRNAVSGKVPLAFKNSHWYPRKEYKVQKCMSSHNICGKPGVILYRALIGPLLPYRDWDRKVQVKERRLVLVLYCLPSPSVVDGFSCSVLHKECADKSACRHLDCDHVVSGVGCILVTPVPGIMSQTGLGLASSEGG